jgi:hypothetical protein
VTVGLTMTRCRHWFLNVALIVGGVIGATALFEVGLRVAGIVPSRLAPTGAVTAC